MVVIENLTKDSGSQGGGSRPETPGSYRNNEIFANTQAMESGSSQDSYVPDISSIANQLEGEDLLPHADKHLAKYDFVGTTDIELEFKRGNVIQVLEKADNGWWQGVCQGQVGWFPESYVDHTPIKMASLSEAEADARGRAGSASSTADVEKPRNMDEMMGTAGTYTYVHTHITGE